MYVCLCELADDFASQFIGAARANKQTVISNAKCKQIKLKRTDSTIFATATVAAGKHSKKLVQASFALGRASRQLFVGRLKARCAE